jgi:nicotinamidase/pyrazinamidase
MKFAKSSLTTDSKNRSAIPQPDKKSALLLVHLQNDFCPGGALAVDGGDQIIPVANAFIRFFAREGFSIIATRDWHPENHCSFQAQGGPWPPHCVQGSRGSQFHPDLKMPPGTLIVSGATNPRKEAYSGFDGTSLEDRLEDGEAQTLFVLGLATDYCVKQTVLDACQRGFRVVVVEDGIRGIDAQPGDSQKALHDMQAAGAVIAKSADFGIHD